MPEEKFAVRNISKARRVLTRPIEFVCLKFQQTPGEIDHVPPGATNDFALDAGNYVKDFWGEGREASYADFPLLGRGPFGQAIRIRKEEDATFRPFLFVPRARLHDSPIDNKGAGKSVSVVVWAIRESGNLALAGIWHEGTDLKQAETASIRQGGARAAAVRPLCRVEQGRQCLRPPLGERRELVLEQIRSSQVQLC